VGIAVNKMSATTQLISKQNFLEHVWEHSCDQLRTHETMNIDYLCFKGVYSG